MYDPDRILALRSAMRACQSAEKAYETGRVDKKRVREAEEQARVALREIRDFLRDTLLEKLADHLQRCSEDGTTIHECKLMLAEVRKALGCSS